MKVLSLLQPWASLVVMGIKKIETRSWQTAYRGELLIHASKGKKGGILTENLPFSKYITHFNELPFGAIVGKVLLYDIQPVEWLSLSNEKMSALTLEEKAFGNYTHGRYAWLFAEAMAFENPIPANGSLMIWEYNGKWS